MVAALGRVCGFAPGRFLLIGSIKSICDMCILRVVWFYSWLPRCLGFIFSFYD